MGYKIITMKRQLLLYLIKLFVGIVIIIICWLALTNIFVECGVIIPANYSETILEENRKRLDDIQQITDNDLPYGSKYSIFDLDYNYERGTMNKSDIEVTKKILLGKESNLQGNYVYSVIARTEEYCVIKYNIKARFNSDNKIFNYIDYDNLSYITMVLVFLLYVYIMTLHLVGIWKNNFEKIEKITLEIEKQNLDFTYEESKIKEFSNIITALIKMRDALKESLYQTWKIENEKNEEIAALAHDIKIPLTIISGNTELLKCYSSDEYSLSHLQSIWGAVGKMEEYINLLIKYVKADRIDFHEKESMPCNSFSHKIVSEIKEYISGSEEIIKFNVEKVRGTIKIDYISLERAIFNIIDNAIEYKVYGDKIMCFIGQKEDSYIFTICNEKGEFSSQVLENGTKLFFTSNNNRNSIHYGIGLAYANKVIQSCEGELELYNSKEHGAVVSIKLPIT